MRALLSSAFARLDLVSREEYDVQAQVLARAREKLEALERRVAELERARSAPGRRAPAVPHRGTARHRSEGSARSRACGASHRRLRLARGARDGQPRA